MEFSDPVEHIASLLTDNGYDRNDGNNAWFELSGQQQQDVVSTLLVLWPFRKQQARPGESPEHTIDNHSRRVGKKSMQQRPMQQPASWCGQEQHTVALEYCRGRRSSDDQQQGTGTTAGTGTGATAAVQLPILHLHASTTRSQVPGGVSFTT